MLSPANRESEERGATIVLVALALTALMSVVALAIDVGMMLNSKSEAQRAADAGAMAGAGMLLSMWGADDAVSGPAAEAEAIKFGEMNNVFDQMADVRPEDVDVDLVDDEVTVRVTRETSRGNAVLTWFARVFGVNEVDIGADATAKVDLASSATCVKPWTIPDAWDDANGDEIYDPGEYYQAEETGWGTDFRDVGGTGYGQMPDDLFQDYTGDRGRQIMVKAGNPNQSTESGWFYPWDIPMPDGPDAGGDRYRDNIINCNPTLIQIGEQFGQEYMVENGNMVGPTKQGVDSLIALDPNAEWDYECECVTGVMATYGTWTASPRVVVVPFYNPTWPIDPGKKPIQFNNFGLMFLEEMQGNTVVARFLGYAPGSGPGENNPGVNLLKVKLIE
ncbi:MAG: pilus assembly protein TadG-related protein [Gemmatimonadota bacterium]